MRGDRIGEGAHMGGGFHLLAQHQKQIAFEFGYGRQAAHQLRIGVAANAGQGGDPLHGFEREDEIGEVVAARADPRMRSHAGEEPGSGKMRHALIERDDGMPVQGFEAARRTMLLGIGAAAISTLAKSFCIYAE